jgi:hypothetical protein
MDRTDGREPRYSDPDGLGNLSKTGIAALVLIVAIAHPIKALKELLAISGRSIKRLPVKATRFALSPFALVLIPLLTRRKHPTFEDYLHGGRDSDVR